MPKRSGARRNKADKEARAKRAEDWKNTRGGDPRTSWMPLDFTNARMEAFFKAQGFVGESEWSKFLDALRSPLPACFRINTGYAFHEVLSAELQAYAGTTVTVEEGKEIEPVRQMKWVTAGNAYKLGADKRTLRKSETLKELHEWMMKNTDNGNITRQEAVSMVPPLALDVQPHHVVLDMCAAPGSKTTQMMEIIDQSLLASPGCEHNNGLVVANDADTDRSYMLVHQTRRMNSPLLLICTHKGQNIPKIRLTDALSGPGGGLSGGYFDRVLADVPCSGDGTLRKNPMIWSRWNTSSAITLHPLQLMIARRGYQVLKPGGLMVYSTCSMMPFEDEAVVAELLRETKGTANELELVDAREFLPLFKARPGMTSWHVLDDHFAYKDSEKKRRAEAAKVKAEAKAAAEAKAKAEAEAEAKADGEAETETANKAPVGEGDVEKAAGSAAVAAEEEEEEEEGPIHPRQQGLKVDDPAVQACVDMGMSYFRSPSDVPESAKTKIKSSLFPPSAEEVSWMHLEKCLRCVPHDEDTGGFFVATLRKKSRPAASNGDAESNGESMKVDGGGQEEGGKGKEEEVVKEEEQQGDSELPAAVDEDASDPSSAAKKSRVDDGGSVVTKVAVAAKSSQVDYLPWDPEQFAAMHELFGFEEGGPIHGGAFFTRNELNAGGHRKGKGKGQNPRPPEDGKPKSVFFLPKPARELMAACELKVVSCGIKAFEKHTVKGTTVDYRLAQDAIRVLAPYMTRRKVQVSAQDLCNLLDGGLVSCSTLSEGFNAALEGMSTGSLVVQYTYQEEDVVPTSSSGGSSTRVATAEQRARIAQRPLYLVCFKGGTRALNVMCQKGDMESMKHMLGALGVLRPKMKAEKERPFTLPGKEEGGEDGSKEGEKREEENVPAPVEATE